MPNSLAVPFRAVQVNGKAQSNRHSFVRSLIFCDWQTRVFRIYNLCINSEFRQGMSIGILICLLYQHNILRVWTCLEKFIILFSNCWHISTCCHRFNWVHLYPIMLILLTLNIFCLNSISAMWHLANVHEMFDMHD